MDIHLPFLFAMKNVGYVMIIEMKSNILKHKDILIAFITPIVILIITFLFLGVYPFGNKNIINSDLYTQYLPIMMHFKRVMSGNGSLFYSLNGGLGTNFYVLNTFQNASPLTWIFLLLFPEEQIVLCATLLLMIKVGLASSTMYYYLKNRYSSYEKAPLIGLSSFYSLCGYVIGYYFNLMWLESVILLPLIILGMRRAIENYDHKLYVIALTLMLCTSYYIGLMTLIFIIVYYFVYYFSEINKDFIQSLKRIALLTIWSILLSMIVLLPTYYAIIKTGNYITLGNQTSSLFYYSFPTHLTQLLPGSNVTILEGPANIYSGLITFILCFIYFFNDTIDKKRKYVKVAFVLFIFFCTNFVIFDVLFQFNHAPNGFPNRYSFVLSFLMIEMAAESLVHIKVLNKTRIIYGIGSVILVYIISLMGKNIFHLDRRFMIVIGIALIVLFGYVFLYINEEETKGYHLLIAMIILFELIANTSYSFRVGGVVESNRLLYHKKEVTQFLERIKEENPYARVEIIGSDNLNAPFLYDYHGLSIFASSVPSDTFTLLNTLWEDPTSNNRNFLYQNPNLIADSLVNLSYYISIDEELDLPWVSEIEHINNCFLYESKYPTSIGYMVPMNMKDLSFQQSREDILNQYVEIASGINNKEINYSKWEELYPIIYDELLEVKEMKDNQLLGTIHVKEDGLLMCSIPYDEGWRVKVDDIEIKDIKNIPYLISFPLSKGEHTIHMVYNPPGFKIGASISVLTILLSIFMGIFRHFKK